MGSGFESLPTHKKYEKNPMMDAKERRNYHVGSDLKFMFVSIIIYLLITGYFFHQHIIGKLTFPWDFFTMHMEPLRWYSDGSFFKPPVWFPYTLTGMPEFLNTNRGGWALPIAIAEKVFTWSYVTATNLQILFIVSSGFFTYILLRFENISRRIALLGSVVFFTQVTYFSNAQHGSIVQGTALIPLVILSFHRKFINRDNYSWLITVLILWQFVAISYPGITVIVMYFIFAFVLYEIYQITTWKMKKSYIFKQIFIALITLGLLSQKILSLLVNYSNFEILAEREKNTITKLHLPTIITKFDIDWIPYDLTMRTIFIPIIILIILFYIRITEINKFYLFSLILLTSIMFENRVTKYIREMLPLLDQSRFVISDSRGLFLILLILVTSMTLNEILRNRSMRFYLERTTILVIFFALFIFFIRSIGINKNYYLTPIVFLIVVIILIGLHQGSVINKNIFIAALLFIHIVNINFIVKDLTSWRMDRVENEIIYYGKELKEFDLRNLPEVSYDTRPERTFQWEPPVNYQAFRNDPRTNLHWLNATFSITGAQIINNSPVHLRIFAELQKPESEYIDFLQEQSRSINIPCHSDVCDELLSQPLIAVSRMDDPNIKVKTISFKKDTEIIQVVSSKDFLLIQNEIYYLGWTGLINESEVEINSTEFDGILRAWKLPAGQYQLIAKFEPKGYQLGNIIFTATFALYLIMVSLYLSRGCKKKNRI